MLSDGTEVYIAGQIVARVNEMIKKQTVVYSMHDEGVAGRQTREEWEIKNKQHRQLQPKSWGKRNLK